VANAQDEQAVAVPAPHASHAAKKLCPVPHRYRSAFEAAASDTNLPLALLVSVGQVESNLDHAARSSAGATGLLQVMPPTAAALRLDPSRPETNVLAGARYLKLMLARFGSTDLALAAYNAGPTAVARDGGAPGSETLTYVANVDRVWQRLEGCS
jgi:soluble lytic murein transglycosylase-like protein